MIRFLIIILIFLFSQITHSIAKTYSTVWGFDITVNNDFVYLGVGNIDNGIDAGLFDTPYSTFCT